MGSFTRPQAAGLLEQVSCSVEFIQGNKLNLHPDNSVMAVDLILSDAKMTLIDFR